ncbi:MAG: thiol:disulfide interchange protein DsbA/DsbL [Candidatus Competibacterales bacterium]|nr:thiol:disulfide interchange protein DsbA/DsbL [Candidatus Competibacterales bacterium]
MSTTRRGLLGGALTLAAAPLLLRAQPVRFQAGVHYIELPQRVPVGSGGPEVAEMFSYKCPHCFSFEPLVERWLETKPEGVAFHRVPVGFGRPDWQLLARAYYVAEELEALETMNQALFDALHVQGRRLATRDELAEVFVANGIDRAAFDSAFDSFAVETKFRRAQQLVQRYRISGVPTLVINGQYRTTGSMAGGNAQMFEVAEFLIARDEAAG